MKKTLVIGMTAVMVLATFMASSLTTVAATTWTVDDEGPPADFSTIQAAINAASDGDTIIVHEGTYTENVIIKGFNGLAVKAVDGDTVTVQAGWNIIQVRDSSSVTIEGLTVTGDGTGTVAGGATGIMLKNSHNCKVLKNEIVDLTHEGIYVRLGSSGNEVAKNEILQVHWGIVLNGADENEVTKNKISDSPTGILIHDSDDNYVVQNEIADLTHEGIFLIAGSSGNEVAKNEISQVHWGIVLNGALNNEVVENEISDSLTGILLVNAANNNEVRENEVTADVEGIFLLNSADNNVQDNEVSDSGWGIVLNGANDNEVMENEVADSASAGISAWWSSDNLIKENEVSGSGWLDLYDSSAPPPLANAWEDNEYETKNW